MIQALFAETKRLDGWPGILTIAFFAAAVYVDFGLWVLTHIDPLQYIAERPSHLVLVPSKAIAFFAGVLVVFVLYLIANMLQGERKVFKLLFALSLLCFGLLGLGAYLPDTPTDGLNAFWHFGAFCWGLEILGVGENKKESTNAEISKN